MSHRLMLIAAASLPNDTNREACVQLCQRLADELGAQVNVTLVDECQLAEMRVALSMSGGAEHQETVTPRRPAGATSAH
ncbi:MAG: hypothetical protein NTZ05_05985 [Chloroflexi bacterium]|nr:hypothetical protein [Chloroflexota bacterium]